LRNLELKSGESFPANGGGLKQLTGYPSEKKRTREGKRAATVNRSFGVKIQAGERCVRAVAGSGSPQGLPKVRLNALSISI
jgi:hypothetical protein